MCRSSRILGFLVLVAIATAATIPADAQARGFGFAGPRFGFGGAGIPLRAMPRFGVGPGFRHGFAGGLRGRLGRFGRFGRGYGIGGLGGFGSFASDGLDYPLDTPRPSGAGVDPAVYSPPVARPTPICPLIIQIGSGLRRAARTKVVYGHQPACR